MEVYFQEDDMDVARLSNTTAAVAVGNKDVTRSRGTGDQGRKVKKAKVVAPPSGVNKQRVQAVLDKMIRNTRFQYDIKDEVGYFVVRIIDQDTDKIIREIPSPELQKIHEGIEHALGLLFDEVI